MRRSLVWLSAATGVLVILSCMGLTLPFEIPAVLAFGWIWYLARTLPNIRVDSSGPATAGACLLLFAAGLHYFLRWVYLEIRKPTSALITAESPWKWRWTQSLVAGTILMFVAGISVVGMTHQLAWLLTSRERLVVSDSGISQRVRSTLNLKQIGIALLNYEEVHHSFPPGGTFERTGRPLQSWQTVILPYIEQEALYRQVDLAQPWNEPGNRPAFQTQVLPYLHPGIEFTKNDAGYALSHYAANAAMLGGDHSRTLAEVFDGTTNTIMAGEVVSAFKPWGEPTNWRDPALGLNRSPLGFGSPSPGGVNFLFADGSVRFLKNSTNPQVLKALSTPAGHEQVSSDQY